MRTIAHIRKTIFGVSQIEFAAIAGTTQASVSRWESNDQEPSHSEMARIRAAAIERGIQWDDRLFFDAPSIASTESAA